jgi:hypothetical protein
LIEQNAPKIERSGAGRRYLPATRFAQQGGITRVRDASNLGICALQAGAHVDPGRRAARAPYSSDSAAMRSRNVGSMWPRESRRSIYLLRHFDEATVEFVTATRLNPHPDISRSGFYAMPLSCHSLSTCDKFWWLRSKAQRGRPRRLVGDGLPLPAGPGGSRPATKPTS